VRGLPDDAVAVTIPAGKTIPDLDSKTKKLIAPPRADFREVAAAGRAIAATCRWKIAIDRCPEAKEAR
jgi:hypothetical protein